MDFNSTTQVGRLVADPEFTPGKKPQDARGIRTDDRVWLRLAVNRPGRNAGTDFFPVCAWGKTAHVFMNYTKKGDTVLVEGSLRTNPKMRPDGSYDSYTEIVAHRVILGPKSAKNTQAVESVAAVAPVAAVATPVARETQVCSVHGEDNPFV